LLYGIALMILPVQIIDRILAFSCRQSVSADPG